MDSIIPGVTRRAFLLQGSGLVLGFAVAPRGSRLAMAQVSEQQLVPMNAFVQIGFDNSVTILSKHLEWGQGIFTGLAALVAEEMDADWGQMRAVHAPADDELYANTGFAEAGLVFQGTFGSSGMANSFLQYREAGAAARALLVAAAAEQWSVPVGEITVSDGIVIHDVSGRSSEFGALIEIASKQGLQEQPKLKDPAEFKFIGKDMPRLDTEDKTTGSALFTLDMYVEDMVVAVVKHPDVFGATVKSFDDSAARKINGVVDVKAVPTGVAVYAIDTFSALNARDQLQVEWDLSSAETRSSAELEQAYIARLASDELLEAIHVGDVIAASTVSEAKGLKSRIVFPFLAHTPMETWDAIIQPADDGGVDILAGSQIQSYDRGAAARVLGIDQSKVRIETQLAGGGFGRRGGWGGPNMAESAEVYRALDGSRPVKFFQTREDDVRGGYYRPMFVHDLKGTIGADGKITAWDHVIVGQTLSGDPNHVDYLMIEGVVDLLYDVPNRRVRTYNETLSIAPMFWRGVAFSHTTFAVETFVDELLESAGRDPVKGRVEHLADDRAKVVLERAAQISNFHGEVPEGRARGIALAKAYKTYIAQVAEVSRNGDGSPKVHKVWCAVDCGLAVNPDMVRSQIEGGISFGLGAFLYSEITLNEGGKIRQSNFFDHRVLRMNEMPEVEVSIIESNEVSTGVGELGVPPIGPAVANAWRLLTGERFQRLPMVTS